MSPKPARPPWQIDWILYEDNDLIILNKPPGLLSVPGRLPENKYSLAHLVEAYLQAPIHIVHRLDMDTSGIILMAKNKDALRILNQQFQNRQTFKRYTALCMGRLPQTQGHIHLPLRCDWENRPKQIVDCRQGKHTHTQWQLCQQFDDYCHLDLFPHTGRSHQLRVHMKMLGHPILGDNLYADTQTQQTSPHLMLHAAELHFQHPRTHQWFKTPVTPPPQTWQNFLPTQSIKDQIGTLNA